MRDFFRTRQAAGWLPPGTDTDRLAKYLACQLRGMAVQARDGVSRRQLRALVALLMTLWPQLARLSAAAPIATPDARETCLGTPLEDGVNCFPYLC
ncbi:hypothetical protein [Candidatus Sodalis endolongispinus]|uniref:hypothetical protein n=1 Tax=Candidatus Sodalis endolongispinus TaxID=2812662 RepID=UPI0028B06264|nr:hypothetical protein [Candidatus Sodalis endolongispinus]